MRLLDLEPRRQLQVPLLLKLGEKKRALHAATQSGDPDLMYTVLEHLSKTTDLGDFLLLIRKYPMALNVHKRWSAHANKQVLEKLHDQEDDRVARAEWAIRNAMQTAEADAAHAAGSKNTTSTTTSTTTAAANSSSLSATTAAASRVAVEIGVVLPAAAQSFRQAHSVVEADLCAEAGRLLRAQQPLADRYPAITVGQSLHSTVRRLLLAGDIKQAERMRSEYRMPDRRFWWLRVQTLAEQFLWEELERFAKAKKSPIGYEPFVEVCLGQGKVEEAVKYLARCRDDAKVKWYLRAG